MEEKKQFQKGRSSAMWFGGAVYVGVVIAATTLYISFVLQAFAVDAYFSKIVMTIAGLLIGASMLAFPYALNNWAISGTHHTVTTFLYYVEMVVIAVNTIISFGALLAENKGYVMPEWAVLYEPFSIVAIVYTLAAWGTVFKLDPQSRRHAKRQAFEDNYEDAIADKTLQFLETREGHAAIEAAAIDDIQARVARARNERPSFHGRKGARADALVDQLFVPKELTTEDPQLGKPFRTDQ